MLIMSVGAAHALLVKTNTFGSAGAGAGQFSGPRGVAVDQGTGDIYVADSGQARIEKWSSSGTFEMAWGWGVADGQSQLETCTTTCQAGISGSGPGQFSSPTSVAVDDATHDVYVGDSGNNVVDKFSSSGAFLSAIDGTTAPQGHFTGLVGIAVDQSGNLWTADSTNNIDEFDNTGVFVTQWNDTYGQTVSITVDSNTGAVYLTRGSGATERWTLAGANETVINQSGTDVALAVDPTTDDLYVWDTSGQVFVYDSANNQIDNFPGTGISSAGGIALLHSAPELVISDAANNDVETFGPPAPGPPVVTDQPASKIGSTSGTLNALVNPFGHDTTCSFQYVDDATFQATGYANATSVDCTPHEFGGAGDFTNHVVTAAITGLSPGTTYHFRAVGTNSAGTVNGDDTTFTTTPPPSIDSESVAGITDTEATLQAQINPNGGDTTYQFQFGTDTNYTGGTVPAKAVDIGAGTTDVGATVNLAGLQPDTTYHFRVVANGNVDGNDMSFHTYPSNLPTGLPDGRGLEMVTPPQKDNGEPFNRFGIPNGYQAATDGNQLAYFSYDAFPGSASDGSYYLATRGSDNWVSQNLIPPQSTQAGLLCASTGAMMFAFNGSLTLGVMNDGASLAGSCGADTPPLVEGEPRGVANLFVRDNSSGTYKLVDVTPSGVTPANAHFDAASADLSHVVFDETAELAKAPNGESPPVGDNLFDWSGGTVKLVTVLPNGHPVAGSIAGGGDANLMNAVSADGSRIYFQANGNLYLRDNGSTTQIDDSQAGGPGGGGTFLGATADGSSVVFSDDASAGLTADTVPGSGTNLYEYTVAGGGHPATLVNLTKNQNPAGGDGLAAISGDGSYVYFVADSVLPGSGAQADGKQHLYVLHAGSPPHLVDALTSSDSCDWTISCESSRISTSGRFLAFNSTSDLTSYAQNGNDEIYLYDAGTGDPATSRPPVCASCNTSGQPPTGSSAISGPLAPVIGVPAPYLQRNVSDSGQVFFNSPDQLLPNDTNKHADVYEWEQGKQYLISTGTSVDDSLFVDASPNGSNVFFTTSQQLLPQDADAAMDIYDARVGGGFPVSAPAPVCTGDGCKPPPTATPPVPPVATVTFSGPGNVKGSQSKKHKKHKKHKKSKKSVVVIRRAIKGDVIAIRVNVPTRGRIAAWGTGVSRISRTVRRAGTVTIALRASSTLKHTGKRKLTIRVRYTPAGGSASTATVKLTVDA